MKLRRIRCNNLTESAKSDFYDLYLLLTSPYLDEPDNQELLADRTTDLCEYFAGKLYQALLFRAEQTGDLDEEDDQDERSYDDLVRVQDPKQRIAIIDRIHQADNSKRRLDYRGDPTGNLIFFGAWLQLIPMLRRLSYPPANAMERAKLLDKFFAMSHNSGPVSEWMRLPWLDAALYVKALADHNEMAYYASPDVVAATKSAANGTGYKPVTNQQYLDLYNYKRERGMNPGAPPVPDDHYAQQRPTPTPKKPKNIFGKVANLFGRWR